jgi:hypothetical protein
MKILVHGPISASLGDPKLVVQHFAFQYTKLRHDLHGAASAVTSHKTSGMRRAKRFLPIME